MSSVEAHVVERICAARIEDTPFPYFYATDVFPAGYYAEMLRQLPSDAEFLPLLPDGAASAGTTSDRYTIRFNSGEMDRLPAEKRAFWDGLADWMLAEAFLSAMAGHIFPYLKLRFFGRSEVQLRQAGSLSRTKQGFFVGPHTDARHKVLTLIFYLPEDDRHADVGTSIYRPRAPGFTCAGGPHHKFDGFERLATFPFLPNSVFGFVKTDNSFHAVEPLHAPGINRDTMVYGLADATMRRTADEGV